MSLTWNFSHCFAETSNEMLCFVEEVVPDARGIDE
jgi:hypothetical protein